MQAHKERVRTTEHDAHQIAQQRVGEKAVESTIDDKSLDKLLAEIDDVLEENATEVVEEFIQQNGQ
jgi:ubiquitin-like protein Pup